MDDRIYEWETAKWMDDGIGGCQSLRMRSRRSGWMKEWVDREFKNGKMRDWVDEIVFNRKMRQ